MTANDRLDTRLPIGFATHPRDLGRGIAVFERATGIIYLSVPKTLVFFTFSAVALNLDLKRALIAVLTAFDCEPLQLGMNMYIHTIDFHTYASRILVEDYYRTLD
jgi:hypothetical protein